MGQYEGIPEMTETCLWPPGGNHPVFWFLAVSKEAHFISWGGGAAEDTFPPFAQGFGFRRSGSGAWIYIFKAACVTDVQLIGENLVSGGCDLPLDRHKLGLEWVI